MKNTLTTTLAAAALAAAAGMAAPVYAEDTQTYEVTVTNITKSMRFTPILTVSHNRDVSAFTLGGAPSAGLADLAEGGATGALLAEMEAAGRVFDSTTSAEVLGPPPLLGPGESVTMTIDSRAGRRLLSMAAMLLPTNDTFMGLNAVRLPREGSATFFARAYDAGSEPNDEFCANIPGPTCGGEGTSASEGGEGFVHVASGIHGIADLDPAVYDFNNPAARVVVTRVR
ncbi:MAG: spondin domain-containing protein [Pseudomonadota bacterium]